jgi:two-component system, NtrC family, sensor histidine kinase HydH
MAHLRTRLRSLARGGLLLALLALGATLVVSAARNYRATEQLSVLLDRSQSERFFRSIPELHERNQGPATSAELARLLADHQSEGLRYLVEYDADGAVLAEAGQHAGSERPRPSRGSSQPVVFGDRVRVTFRPPRGPMRREPPPPARGGEADGRGPPLHAFRPPPGPSHAGSLPDLVLEFEPTVANQLRDRASKNFVFSTAAALSLLALTVGLWLSLRREERRRERTERERQLASLGEMSAVLAHELRNPLASLKGNAQLLAEQLDPSSPLQKKVTRVVTEAKRLEELTGTLLDLVRSSSVSPTPCDPRQLLREAAEAVAPERIELNLDRAPASWPLDALRMDQVLKNLLQNAVQASADGGRVHASAAVERGKLVIRVRDHGAGLPEGSQERLFEAFHTTRTHGTGLGLAVARRIVELHGGRIQGETHPSGGALFTLWLPA